MISITGSDENHLKLSYIFALVLIIIKVDCDLDNKDLTNDHILNYIFPDEASADKEANSFERKLNRVFGDLKNSTLISQIAIPLLIQILEEPLSFNNLFSLIFIFTKDILPQSSERRKRGLEELNINSNRIFKFEIYKNSIMGKFIHSAYLIYSDDSINQEKYNSIYLKEIGKRHREFYLKNLSDYQQNSFLARILLLGDNIKTFEEFKYDYLDDKTILPIYLKDLVPYHTEQTKLKLNKFENSSVETNTILSNYNMLYVKDYFFKRLDTCSNQYELINLINTLVCHEKYARETRFVLEIVSTIMQSHKFEDDKLFHTMMFVFIYITLSFEPSLMESGIINRNLLEQLRSIDQELEQGSFQQASIPLAAYIHYLLAKVRYSTYKGNFQAAYTTLIMATKMKLLNMSETNGQANKLEETNFLVPILYERVKEDFTFAMGLDFSKLKHLNGNLLSKINSYNTAYFEKDDLVNGYKENNLEQIVYYKKYNDINLLAEQGNYAAALCEIDEILEHMNKDSYLWKFEFNLLKCLIFENSCNNVIKVMKKYRDTFIDNKAYLGTLDLYRKLLVGANYTLLMQKNKDIKSDDAYKFYYQNSPKVNLFKGTRLIKVWEDIYANL
ncbi:hypothetical protein FOG51_00711 [Hanseniaspora uvarum]|nr:hypothetical protein FOG51_00711 [Hanseniaspora uvarum]